MLRKLNVFTFWPIYWNDNYYFAPMMSANYTFILKNSGNDATYSGYLDKTVCLVSANNLPKTCTLRAIWAMFQTSNRLRKKSPF